MLSITIQIIFGTGRLLGADCSGAFLLDGSENGAIDIECSTVTVGAETNPSIPKGNVSVKIGKTRYEGCSAPYTSGTDASGVMLYVYCP